MIEVLQPPLRDEPPSTYAISAWIDGEPGALGRVVNLTLTRSLFIAPGLYLSGVREPKQLLKTTVAASLSITGGLALVYWLRRRRGVPTPSQVTSAPTSPVTPLIP